MILIIIKYHLKNFIIYIQKVTFEQNIDLKLI
jgi:hypothetical protein